MSGFHHFHRRKRIHQKLEKYPSKNKWINLFDKLVYGIIAFTIIITLPQVFKIYIEKNASGISLISWIGYLCVAFFWSVYGILHKEKAIILTNAVSIVLQLLIIIGTLIYGKGFW